MIRLNKRLLYNWDGSFPPHHICERIHYAGTEVYRWGSFRGYNMYSTVFLGLQTKKLVLVDTLTACKCEWTARVFLVEWNKQKSMCAVIFMRGVFSSPDWIFVALPVDIQVTSGKRFFVVVVSWFFFFLFNRYMIFVYWAKRVLMKIVSVIWV